MQLRHEFTIPQPIDQAWLTLLDVRRIAPCLPGATVERAEGDDVEGRVAVKVGPMSVSYRGTARFVEKDESSRRFVLEGHGRDTRGAGTASATITGQLLEEGTSTKVRIDTDLDLTGKPAQFGRGVLSDVAGNLIGQFASCLARGGGAGPGSDDRPRSESTSDMPARSESSADSLDVFATVAPAVRKRFVPVLLAFVALLGWLLTRRASPTVVVHVHLTPPRNRPHATPGIR